MEGFKSQEIDGYWLSVQDEEKTVVSDLDKVNSSDLQAQSDQQRVLGESQKWQEDFCGDIVTIADSQGDESSKLKGLILSKVYVSKANENRCKYYFYNRNA